jgi:tol-pal system protein YbgF
MNYTRFISTPLLMFSISILLLGFVFGCGASRQNVEGGEDVNIDDLLTDESAASSSQNSDEDEVLRLLGITPEQTQPAETTVANVPDEAAQTLEGDINQLEGDLMERDREISTLRSEITQREAKISELESRLEATSKRNSFQPSGPVSDAPAEFKARYQSALNLFNSRSYQQALNAFIDLLATDENTSLSDNCQYWIGESYYAMGNHNQAIVEFSKVFRFPNSNKSDDAQLKLGLCYMKLGDKQQARAEFDRLIASYPQSEYVSLAQNYIGRL